MVKKLFGAAALAFALLGAGPLAAETTNLVRDSEADASPIPGEFCFTGDPKEGTLTRVVEDLTWNRCLRIDFREFGRRPDGKRVINLGLEVRGSGKEEGYPCRGGTTFAFSFEAKGSAPYVLVDHFDWTAKGVRTEKPTDLGTFTPTTNGWTVYRGTFTTQPDAVRTALVIKFWGDETSHVSNFRHRPGDWLMVDKFFLAEKPAKKPLGAPAAAPAEIKPLPAVLVNAANGWSAPLPAFFDNILERPARYGTDASLRATAEGLEIAFACAGAEVNVTNPVPADIWSGDMMQFFFDVPCAGESYLQLAVNATGERWMNGRGSDLTTWRAEVAATRERWSGKVVVPWKTLGYAARPEDGRRLRFLLARQQRVIGVPSGASDPAKGNRRYRYGLFMDDSAWPFPNGIFADRSRWALLFFGTVKPYADEQLKAFKTPEYRAKAAAVDLGDPARALGAFAAYRAADRMAALAQRKFIVAQISPQTDPSVPFLPEALESPQDVFRVRGAVNEHAPLALALANMTDRFEEYRVTLVRGWRWGEPEPQNERWRLAPGLETAKGEVLRSFTVRRGVVTRDSDQENHGARLDILAQVNEVSSVPVPAKEGGLVWIDFDLHGAKPGLYKGYLVVTPLSGGRLAGKWTTKIGANDDGSLEAPVELEVLPFALEEPSTLPLCPFRSAYNDYYFDFAAQYDVSMYWISPYHFRCAFNADGSIAERKPLSYLAPHIRLIAAKAKPQPPMRKCMICYNSYVVFKTVILGSQIPYDTPEYWRAYREWLRYVDETMNANGLATADYTIEVFDEPSLRHNPMSEIARAIRETRAAVPAINITNTNGERELYEELSPTVDNWIFGQYIFGDEKQMAKVRDFRAKPGRTLSMYACETSLRLDLYRYYRLLPWKAAACGADYVSIYQFFEINTGMDFRRTPGGALAYDTTEALVPSVRLENLRIGMTDIRYLRHLAARATDDTPQAKAARDFIAQSLREVTILKPHEKSLAPSVREKCIDLILKLEAK